MDRGKEDSNDELEDLARGQRLLDLFGDLEAGRRQSVVEVLGER